MTRILLLTAAALTLAGCGQGAPPQPAAGAPQSAQAADAGPLQAGLWETETQDEAEGGAPKVSRTCIGEDEKGSPEEALAFDDPDCKVTRTSGLAGSTVHAECLKDGVKFVTDASWAAHRTNYRFSLTTKAILPGGGTHESRTTAKGRRLGACPAGMAPGETQGE